MNIEELKISEIQIDKDNPREATPEQIEIYKNIFKRFGMAVPIIIDSENKVFDENGKLEAARELNFETVKAVRLEKLSEDEVKGLKIAEIRAREKGIWNDKKLLEILSKIDKELLNITGFNLDELAAGIDEELESCENIEEIEIPEVEENYFTQQGDIYLLGNHKLLCGDSTNIEDVKKLMDGELASLMITDPPYNINYESESGMKIKNDNMATTEFYDFLSKFYKNAYEIMKEGASYYIFHADSETISFRKALEEAKFKFSQNLIWVKNAFNLSRQDYNWRHEPCLYGWKPGMSHFFIKDFTQDTILEDIEILKKKTKAELLEYIENIIKQVEEYSTVIRENKPQRNDVHPTMKPIKLIARLMINSSKKKQNVVDLFGGSGSTLIAAEQLERKAYLMEYDPKYADVIVKRYLLLGKEDISLIREGKEYTWEDIKEHFE